MTSIKFVVELETLREPTLVIAMISSYIELLTGEVVIERDITMKDNEHCEEDWKAKPDGKDGDSI